MCGIFGYISQEERCPQIERCREALNTLRHRGPDQWSDWYDHHVYMGHRRLSIIDLSENAKQPMSDANKRVVICVNGEIYNYKSLRDVLKQKYGFKSMSDSEVILYGYMEWGLQGLLSRLNGMFAICLYDRDKRKLFLIRDRFGKKPVYYAIRKGMILFASEIKAIFEYDDSFKVFSYDGIKDWIYHRGGRSGKTIYSNVYRLSPGEYLEVGSECLPERRKYYDLYNIADMGIQSASIDELDSLLADAVSRRLMADVPVGLQLSGGVDSSLVAYYLRQCENADDVHSFSIGFSEREFVYKSEEKYARHVAQLFNLTHHQYNIVGDDFAKEFMDVVWLFDGMLEYPNSVPIYILSKKAKKYITVSLTGEGADELFGGYTKFLRMNSLVGGKNTSLVDQLKTMMLGSVYYSFRRESYLKRRYANKPRQILEDMNCYISRDTFLKYFGDPDHSLFDDIDYTSLADMPFYKQCILMDHSTYLCSLFDRQDRASMGASIEARVPFVDQQLVEWAIRLRQEDLFSSKDNKILLKKKAEQLFGTDFVYRNKNGFSMPIISWIKNCSVLRELESGIYKDDFILSQKIDLPALKKYIQSRSFDHKNLNYGGSEKIWIVWFLIVLRAAQDIFQIQRIK